jgi:hypothetical protein
METAGIPAITLILSWLCRWQRNRKGSSFIIGIITGDDIAAMVLDNFVRNCQTQTSTSFLGREKGFEDLGLRSWG